MRIWPIVLVLACFLLAPAVLAADALPSGELPPGMHVPAAAQPGPGFDVDRATEAWLSLLTPEQQARSNAYFEGNYWLRLWELLYAVAVLVLLLGSGWSARMRSVAQRVTRRPWPSTIIYAVLFIVATFVLGLPLAYYAGFVREHAYGLSNLSFGGWVREELMGLAVSLVLGAVAIAVLYAVLGRVGKRWWLLATALAFAGTLFITFAYPLVIAPLFNAYKPLPEGETREAILSLARANEIPTQHLEWFDASKQTKRVSANVAGMGPVARIALNDNLLERTSLPEIKAVLGHEMGHYVLNHGWGLAIYLGLLTGLAFAIVEHLYAAALLRYGARFGIAGHADPAGLPLFIALFSVVWFALSPFVNTVIRTAEQEADAFGLNAAREPQGFAMVSVRLSTYRKLRPGPIEEFIFYDHPSGYDRVRRSMVWQKENLSTR